MKRFQNKQVILMKCTITVRFPRVLNIKKIHIKIFQRCTSQRNCSKGDPRLTGMAIIMATSNVTYPSPSYMHPNLPYHMKLITFLHCASRTPLRSVTTLLLPCSTKLSERYIWKRKWAYRLKWVVRHCDAIMSHTANRPTRTHPIPDTYIDLLCLTTR